MKISIIIFTVFVGITRWENCLWRVLRNFNDVRENGAIPPIDPENRVAFDTAEKVLKDKKNRCIGNSTRFIATHALAAAFKEPQKFVNLVLTVSIPPIKSCLIFSTVNDDK